MPTSTQDSGRDRRLLVESLRAFSRGVNEAPLITKWTHSAEAGAGLHDGIIRRVAGEDNWPA